jgi:hypothetical protein
MSTASEGKLSSGTTGWTVESAVVHFNEVLSDQKDRFREALEAQEKKNQQQFADADKAVRAAMAAASTASDKAEANSEKWRANANEWRQAMNDRERNFAPVQRLDSIEKTVDESKENLYRLRESEAAARTQLRIELTAEIGGLRESRSEGTGEKESQFHGREHNKWIVSIVVTIVTSAMVVMLVQLMHH